MALTEILDRLPIGITIFDAGDCVEYWNPAYLSLFPEEQDILRVGLPYIDTLRRFFEANLSEREQPSLDRHLAAGLERHKSRQRFQYQRRDGRWYEVVGHDLADGRLLKVWLDVTRSRVHGAAKSRLDDALASISVGLGIYDPSGRYLLSNKALDEIFPSSVSLHRPGVGYADHLAEYIANALAEEETDRLVPLTKRGLPTAGTLRRGEIFRTRDRRFLALDEHIGIGGELFVAWQDITAEERNQRLLRDGMNLLEQIAKNADLPEVLTMVAAMVEDHCKSIDCIAVLFEGDGVHVHQSGHAESDATVAATSLALREWRAPDDGTTMARPRPAKSVQTFFERFEPQARRFGLTVVGHLPLGPEGEPPAGLLLAIARDGGGVLEPDDFAVMDRAAQLAILAIEHDRRAREVQDARETAEIANRAKSDFLAKMSHELRTPLNAIIGFAEMMATGMVGDSIDRHRDYAAMIRQSGQHLLSVINDILDISRIESGHVVLCEEPSSLNELWAECAEIIGPRAAARGIRFEPNPVVDVQVLCDPTKARQCMLNVVSNAVKFTPDGGTIGIAIVVGADGAAEFAVADRGCGMDEKQIVEALRPFGQVEPARHTEQTGVGLGLPITSALMELHEGGLVLESSPGQGTTARLRFPKWRRLPTMTDGDREIA